MRKKFILEFPLTDSLNSSLSISTSLDLCELLLLAYLSSLQFILILSVKRLKFLLLSYYSAVGLLSVVRGKTRPMCSLSKGRESVFGPLDIVHQYLVYVLVRLGSVLDHLLPHPLLQENLELHLLLWSKVLRILD
jgi:hypothetical protein